MGKTPRGGAIALPIPTQDDIDRAYGRSDEEATAFATAIYQIPLLAKIMRRIQATSGIEASLATMTMLSVMNETELRENRGHAR